MGFSQIVDEVRLSLVIRYVEKGELAPSEVVLLLGFSRLNPCSHCFPVGGNRLERC